MKKIKKFVLNIFYQSIEISKNKKSIKVLGLVSFSESIFFPIPPDIFLIPIVFAKKNQWFSIGIYCTIFSVLGGIVGYFLGYYFWDSIGNSIVKFYNAEEQIDNLKFYFSKYGWLLIFLAGFTPIPYKIFTIGSGLLTFNFFTFLLCSFISRGLRFITLAYLIKKYGEKGILLVEKHFFKLMLLMFFVILSISMVYYL